MADRLVLQGRFKVLQHLGGGGMSDVFLAEQVSLGRLVALKVLKRDFARQPEMAERFRREALILSTVDHPSVVRVIDYESGKDGTVLVLELAEGDTLQQALAPGQMEPRRAQRLLWQLADGVAAIHEKGIIHRDLKPQNVIVTPTARGEQARLLDFGIARLMELSDDGSTPPSLPLSPGAFDVSRSPFVSHPGQAVGTPAYVAPEQALALPMDVRTDVYSFGVLAYRMLAGRLPFDGPGTREYLEQHVKVAPPPLSLVAPHLESFPSLVRLVMQCLEKKPEARPRDGQALAEALHLALPPDAAPPTTHTRRALGALTSQTWSTVQTTAGALGKTGLTRARQAATLAREADPQLRRSVLAALLAVAAIPAAWALVPATPAEEVERLLLKGQAQPALERLEKELPQARGELPVLLGLRAAALHRLNRPEAERAQLREAPYQALHTARPVLLESLAEDYARAEDDAELRELLALVPAGLLQPTFQALARGPLSEAQWGALRFLDATGRAEDLALRYRASLQSPSCAVRATAATRLGSLGHDGAIGALRELSETPKDETQRGPRNCGQDEAAEAIRQIRKGR